MLATVPVAVRNGPPATAYTTLMMAVLAVLYVEWQYIKIGKAPTDAVVVSRDEVPSLNVSITSPQTNDG
jgi:hypothetical protein